MKNLSPTQVKILLFLVAITEIASMLVPMNQTVAGWSMFTCVSGGLLTIFILVKSAK